MKYIGTALQGILLSAAILGSLAKPKGLHILLYDEHSDSSNPSLQFFKDRSKALGIRTTVYGGTLKERGSGDKLRLLKPILEVADSQQLIVVANAHEVLLNAGGEDVLDSFLKNFAELTQEHPNAVVVSAEEHCCSAAMSHSSPGDFFEGLERKHQACASGGENCLSEDNERVVAWKESMLEMALEQTVGDEEYKNVYLNSGILAGTPKNLMNLLKVSDINSSEDDRAVLTDLMLAAPDMILLDYHQKLFGSNAVHKGLHKGCVYESNESGSLVHTQLMTSPLILHTPNAFYDCFDTLMEAMGGVSQKRFLKDYGAGDEGLARRLADFKEDETQRKLPEYFAPVDSDGNYGYGIYVWSPEEFLNTFIFGPYGIFSNYGNYGNYGQYGNYGFFNYMMESMFGITPGAMSGNSGGGSQYGFLMGFDWLFGNYGQYGNYGMYSNYGYGSYATYGSGRRLRGDQGEEKA